MYFRNTGRQQQNIKKVLIKKKKKVKGGGKGNEQEERWSVKSYMRYRGLVKKKYINDGKGVELSSLGN